MGKGSLKKLKDRLAQGHTTTRWQDPAWNLGFLTTMPLQKELEVASQILEVCMYGEVGIAHPRGRKRKESESRRSEP